MQEINPDPDLTWERSVSSYLFSQEIRDNVLQRCKCPKSEAAEVAKLNVEQLFAMFSQ